MVNAVLMRSITCRPPEMWQAKKGSLQTDTIVVSRIVRWYRYQICCYMRKTPENAYFKPLSGICRHTLNTIELSTGKKTSIPWRKHSVKSEASILLMMIEVYSTLRILSSLSVTLPSVLFQSRMVSFFRLMALLPLVRKYAQSVRKRADTRSGIISANAS